MAIDRGWAATVCVAAGAAALVFAAVPAVWPVPVPEGPAGPALLPGLVASAAAVDAACARGDTTAFAAATTAAHRRTLARHLAVLDQTLDAAALRALAARPQVDWLAAEPLAGTVRGNRSAVVVPRADGQGAQVLAFEWDGQRWRLDDCRHVRAVQDAATAAAVAADAALSRRR